MRGRAIDDSAPSARQALPLGVKDIVLDEAAALTNLQAGLRDLALAWGYSDIITPTFEYAATLAVAADDDLQRQMYRFVDREGHLLALRADITTAVARITGSKLNGLPMPLRLFYIENVFRHVEPRAGRQHEFFQAGIELIGAPTAEADAEVLALAVESLLHAGVRHFQLTAGHIGFFTGLAEALNLPPGKLEHLRAAIDRKDAQALDELAAQFGVAPAERALLAELPRLYGGPEVLRWARKQISGFTAPEADVQQHATMIAALDRLAAIYGCLVDYGSRITEHITIDLGEVRGLDYYTGMMFEVFAEGLGYPVITGGRYDDLIGNFGPAMPAVGYAVDLERVLAVQQTLGVSVKPYHPVIAINHAGERGMALVRQLREANVPLELEVLRRDADQLRRDGHRVGWLLTLGEHHITLARLEENDDAAKQHPVIEWSPQAADEVMEKIEWHT